MNLNIFLNPITPDSPDLTLAEKLNEQAFPENERVSFSHFFRFAEHGDLEILGIYSDAPEISGFCGFFVMHRHLQCAYICYFAVCPEKRSRGVGGAALRELAEYYPNRHIVVDFEAPDESCDNNEQRLRRRRFYYRNGFRPSGYYQYYMDTEFEIATTAEVFDKEEFESLISHIHERAPEFDPKLYRKD